MAAVGRGRPTAAIVGVTPERRVRGEGRWLGPRGGEGVRRLQRRLTVPRSADGSRTEPSIESRLFFLFLLTPTTRLLGRTRPSKRVVGIAPPPSRASPSSRAPRSFPPPLTETPPTTRTPNPSPSPSPPRSSSSPPSPPPPSPPAERPPSAPPIGRAHV